MAPPKLSAAQKRAGKRNVRRMLEGIAAEVAELPRSSLRELMPILAAAEREVAFDLTQWLKHAQDGGERFTAHQLRSVLLQLRTARVGARDVVSRVPAWLRRISDGVSEVLKKGSRGSGALATKHLMQEVVTFDQMFQSSLTPLPLKQAAILARGDKALVPRYESSARRYAGNIWVDMRRQLSIGVARGQTIDQVVERLRKLGGPGAETAAGGLFTRYRHWGERVVRTEVINAYNVHHTNGLKELSKKDRSLQQRWDSSLDRRLCVICRGLHGQIVEIGAEFPGGYLHPPAHPNCRCAVVAWHESWSQDVLPDEPITKTQE